MFKNFEDQTILFDEDSIKPNFLKHYCDDGLSMYQYKKDRTFNEMRRDIYYKMYSTGYGYDNNIAILNKKYTLLKNNLTVKQHNMLLHELFLNNKTHKIIKLINDFDIVSIVKIPNAFKKIISNARFILYDGNCICLLCCDDMYFYVLDWRGS